MGAGDRGEPGASGSWLEDLTFSETFERRRRRSRIQW
jgi:hypothetical protein